MVRVRFLGLTWLTDKGLLPLGQWPKELTCSYDYDSMSA